MAWARDVVGAPRGETQRPLRYSCVTYSCCTCACFLRHGVNTEHAVRETYPWVTALRNLLRAGFLDLPMQNSSKNKCLLLFRALELC